MKVTMGERSTDLIMTPETELERNVIEEMSGYVLAISIRGNQVFIVKKEEEL